MTDPRRGIARAYPFEAGPLVEPVDRASVKAFVAEMRRAGRLPAPFSGSSLGVILAVIVAAVVFGSVFLTMISVVISAFAATAEGAGWSAALAALAPLIVIVAIIAVLAVAVLRGGIARHERMFRLDRFARANAMSYVPHLDSPPLPGMIFSIGSSRRASDVVRGARPRFVEFANYRYVTGSGKNRTTHAWGYVAVKLDVPLPHIVLDATGNNGLFGSNLPQAFDRDQRLSLEGDFDRYFALYCPAGYERDALYLFTPDIMARFIDNAAALDVEIVDDWLFLYAKRDFSTLDPATWAWLFSVVGALLDKLGQWARWRDERLRIERHGESRGEIANASSTGETGTAASTVPFDPPLDALRPPPGVAPQGRRLQKGVPWVSVIVIGLVVLWWILSSAGVLR